MDILVPTDGSEWGNRAVVTACHLAGSGDLVHLLHVIDSRLVQPMTGGLEDTMAMPEAYEHDEALEAYCQEATEILEECATLCADAGATYSLEQATGIPRKVILSRAANCDLLVLAKRGFSPMRLSTRTRWILQRITCPALALSRPRRLESMLLGYDGSLGSDEMVDFVIQLLSRRPLNVVVLCLGSEIRSKREKADAAAHALGQAGFGVTVEWPHDESPFAALLAAQEHEPDVVAVCAPHPGPLGRLLGRGDLVTYVAEGVDASVLAFRT